VKNRLLRVSVVNRFPKSETPMFSFLFKFVMLPLIAFGGGLWVAHHWDEGAIANLKLADANAALHAAQTAMANQKKQDATALTIALRNATAQEQIRVVTRTLIEKVPTYVSRKADLACVVPFGFVRVFDAAASGVDPAALPGTAGEPDDAPSGVALSRIAALSAEHDGQYRAVTEQLIELQNWVRAEGAGSSSTTAR
jgi:hypothetical protein